jgi:hypothetical protein
VASRRFRRIIGESADWIAVMGCTKGFFGTKRRKIGHVPSMMAASIEGSGLLSQVNPMHYSVGVSDREDVYISLQITGPKELCSRYNRGDVDKRLAKGEELGPSHTMTAAEIREAIRDEISEEEDIEILRKIRKAEEANE